MRFILIIFSLSLFLNVSGQEKSPFPQSEEEFQIKYQRNINKSRINGVYIPVDEEDAFEQITKLSEEDAWDKFKTGEEQLVVSKLKLGLGRWMNVNWNFYEGSRLSHYLKQKGLLHPEDMSAYLMTYFHRKLNKKNIEKDDLIFQIAEERRKRLKEEADLYKTEVKKIPEEK